MIYTANVRYFDGFDERTKNHYLFISAHNYEEAAKEIIAHYSNGAIESFTLTAVAPCKFLTFEEKDKEIFDKAVEAIF